MGIVDAKSRIVQGVDVIKLHAVEELKAFRVDDQADVFLLDDMITGGWQIELHHVLRAGAPAFFHAQSQSPRRLSRLLGEQGA